MQYLEIGTIVLGDWNNSIILIFFIFAEQEYTKMNEGSDEVDANELMVLDIGTPIIERTAEEWREYVQEASFNELDALLEKGKRIREFHSAYNRSHPIKRRSWGKNWPEACKNTINMDQATCSLYETVHRVFDPPLLLRVRHLLPTGNIDKLCLIARAVIINRAFMSQAATDNLIHPGMSLDAANKLLRSAEICASPQIVERIRQGQSDEEIMAELLITQSKLNRVRRGIEESAVDISPVQIDPVQRSPINAAIAAAVIEAAAKPPPDSVVKQWEKEDQQLAREAKQKEREAEAKRKEEARIAKEATKEAKRLEKEAEKQRKEEERQAKIAALMKKNGVKVEEPVVTWRVDEQPRDSEGRIILSQRQEMDNAIRAFETYHEKNLPRLGQLIRFANYLSRDDMLKFATRLEALGANLKDKAELLRMVIKHEFHAND